MKAIGYLALFFITISPAGLCQFSPAAGIEGSKAIHKDSSIFSGWATNCEVARGYLKISDTTFTYEGNNKASAGEAENATGKANGKTVSLGDSGITVVYLDNPLVDGKGADFAVFENGFESQELEGQYFLELAFVEVSSDGERYVRFPAVSNTPVTSQVGTFGQIDPTMIHNFAGKYPQGYGTPFDVSELSDSAGIDLQSISWIKIIDAVGTLIETHVSMDATGNAVNDPWPTPFPSGGFDLDAVGLIHLKHGTSIKTNNGSDFPAFRVYPNPAIPGRYVHVELENQQILMSEIITCIRDIEGRVLYQKKMKYKDSISFILPRLHEGMYFVEIKSPHGSKTKKILVHD